jgi:hypothetical protein
MPFPHYPRRLRPQVSTLTPQRRQGGGPPAGGYGFLGGGLNRLWRRRLSSNIEHGFYLAPPLFWFNQPADAARDAAGINTSGNGDHIGRCPRESVFDRRRGTMTTPHGALMRDNAISIPVRCRALPGGGGNPVSYSGNIST